MEKLSEELLDHIVCEVMNPLPNRFNTCYDDLLSLSMVSRKFCRITEPYIYRSLIMFGDNEVELLQTMNSRPALSRYTTGIHIMYYYHLPREVLDFVLHLPNLQRLDIDIASCRLSKVIPILKLPSITVLILSDVSLKRNDSRDKYDWTFANDNITYLEISFSDPEIGWEACEEMRNFAAVFRKLQCLHINSVYEGPEATSLNGPAFRCLVQMFKHAFETTLRDFSFMYNDLDHGAMYEGDVAVSDQFDARAILRHSRLEHLMIDTMCLHTPRHTQALRSLTIGPSCFPASLHTLYVRHLVASGNLNPVEKNLMHSDEAQCLSQLVNLAARKSRFPHLERMTLAISLPAFFAEVASRVVRVQSRQAKIQLDLMFM
ncbi:hypothetical protein P3342_006681 [Pyrenophora teres f. teres]|uniref:F-box domain-containing protein n=2 Tax=Pyrenophora teres f. teres TaxID=97479 RepID=E3RV03_PYRTT|nr:hypothetical protein PTT_12975 [Pyrenophora teres f. teres 0-1]KAK1910404.1 hypothetical protein P3342_006681 [Pyrenophora teres f. teres]CAE7031733.1 hypothetical protein PTTW11_04854 [Pyrenophora teres f. teres]